jgi:hypothetical protein
VVVVASSCLCWMKQHDTDRIVFAGPARSHAAGAHMLE